MCFSQREALTYQFYSLGESPCLVSATPSVELNITAGETSTQECQSVFCCAFFVTTVLLSNYCTHAHFCHSFAHACSTALKTKAAALLTMALAIVLFAILQLLPAKALIWRS